jgi:hypothetical protein
MSAGPRHWFVLGSRTRPLPHPPNSCSWLVPCMAGGTEVVAGDEGGGAAPTVAAGFRTGAPAANALAGITSIAVIVVTATKSRRHIKASHGRQLTYYNDDDRGVQPPRRRAVTDCGPSSGVTPLPVSSPRSYDRPSQPLRTNDICSMRRSATGRDIRLQLRSLG